MSNYSKDADLKRTLEKSETAAGLAQVRDSVSALGQHVQNDSIQIAKSVKDAAQSRIDGVNDYTDSVKKQLSDKPLQTIALAVVAGALLNMLFGRR